MIDIAIAISGMFFAIFIVCWMCYPYRDIVKKEKVVRLVICIVILLY